MAKDDGCQKDRDCILAAGHDDECLIHYGWRDLPRVPPPAPEAEPRMFSLQPAQREYSRAAAPLRIPWSVAEKAHAVYASRYGGRSAQSLERLAERGGFSVEEMDTLYPAWREEVSEIASLRAQLAEARELSAMHKRGIEDLAAHGRTLTEQRDTALRELDAARAALGSRPVESYVSGLEADWAGTRGALDAALARVRELEGALRECSQGQGEDGLSCWCCIPSMVPYRGHDVGCSAARAALLAADAGKEPKT